MIFNESFYYHKVKRKISNIIRFCDSCQRNKLYNLNTQPLAESIIPEAPNDLLSIDFIGPFVSSTGGVKPILKTVDAFSKFVVLYNVKNQNGPSVLKKLQKDYFIKYGKPKRIQMDHGTQFTSDKFIALLYNPNMLIFVSTRNRIYAYIYIKIWFDYEQVAATHTHPIHTYKSTREHEEQERSGERGRTG